MTLIEAYKPGDLLLLNHRWFVDFCINIQGTQMGMSSFIKKLSDSKKDRTMIYQPALLLEICKRKFYFDRLHGQESVPNMVIFKILVEGTVLERAFCQKSKVLPYLIVDKRNFKQAIQANKTYYEYQSLLL